jgi:hypothetical protein
VDQRLRLRKSQSVTDKLPALAYCLHGGQQLGRGMCLDNVTDCARVHGLFDYTCGGFLADEQYSGLGAEFADSSGGFNPIQSWKADV